LATASNAPGVKIGRAGIERLATLSVLIPQKNSVFGPSRSFRQYLAPGQEKYKIAAARSQKSPPALGQAGPKEEKVKRASTEPV
jgi:hypothetical protein